MSFRLTTDLRRMARDVRALGRQAEFAQVVALTRLATLDVKPAEVREVDDSFDRPNPFTRNAFYVKPATREHPEAVVGIKDDVTAGRGPVHWFDPEIRGGRRELQGFERAIRSLGVMDGTQFMVPGRYARLDQYGNISRGQIVQILSQLRAFAGAETVSRNLVRRDGRGENDDRRLTRAEAARKRAAAFRRSGGQYFAVGPAPRGGLKPGIYQRQVASRGLTGPASRRPRLVMLFVDRVSYEPRFDFFTPAEQAVERNFRRRMDEALDQYVRFSPN
jgi:hypothetical protein